MSTVDIAMAQTDDHDDGQVPAGGLVSIRAKIVADRTGRWDVRPLTDTEGPIDRGPQGHR